MVVALAPFYVFLLDYVMFGAKDLERALLDAAFPGSPRMQPSQRQVTGRLEAARSRHRPKEPKKTKLYQLPLLWPSHGT